MSRETLICTAFICDDCGDGDADEGGSWHHAEGETPDGWQVIDGKDVCEQCVCARAGHNWTEWEPSYLSGGTREHRYCNSCDRAMEERPAEGKPKALTIAGLIERGSLGTPEAKALRESVDPADVARVLARVRELQEPTPRKDQQ